MFEKKEDGPKLVGALEKRALAERMRYTKNEEIKQAAGMGVTDMDSQAIPVTVIFALATGVAMLLLDGALLGSSAWHLTGVLQIDLLLFSTVIPQFVGDPDMDRLILTLLRGTALFLLAGVIPFVAAVGVRVVGKWRLNPFIACWGMIIALPLLLCLAWDRIEALLMEIGNMF